MKRLLDNVNLKEQITEELKKTWYYEQIEWGLKINKHSVIFDNEFKFELKEYDWEDEILGVEIIVMMNGEKVYDEETIRDYGLGKYQDRPYRILNDICCYIANRI